MVLGWNLRILLSHLKLVPSNLSNCIFPCKIKIPKFGTKNALFWYFWTGILKKYYHNWNQCPWIFLIAKFGAKTKILIFGTKNALFGYFKTRIWEQYSHIWNQRPWICIVVKFWEKMKMSKFGSKNALFGYFWAGILRNSWHI